MKSLTIVYDDRCELCTRAARWLRRQPAHCALFAVPHDAAERRFPEAFPRGSRSEVVAVTDTGDIYRGDAAWLITLYTLREYRALSFTLAKPRWRPHIRRAIELLGRKRMAISNLLMLLTRADTGTACPNGACSLRPSDDPPTETAHLRAHLASIRVSSQVAPLPIEPIPVGDRLASSADDNSPQ